VCSSDLAIFENVDGLQNSNIVTINGFTVGVVSDIRFETEKLDRLIVEIGVKNSFKIPDNSVMLLDSDMLGTKSIVLLMGNSSQIAKSGDFLRDSVAFSLIESLSSRFEAIADNANKLMTSVDTLVLAVRSTFDDDMQKQIKTAVSVLEEMIITERRRIAMMLSNFESISRNLQQQNSKIAEMIGNLNEFSGSLADIDLETVVSNATKSLSELHAILNGINEGEGTIGKFVKDDALYEHLTRSAEDLDKLLIDLRENPKRYVNFSLFGGKKN
jgi:phospholipid/cholesterol/gamma-HCH transport system substrate-binding protein